MNLKITYLICNTILNIFLIIMAVITPIYLTVGYYWWSCFFIILMLSLSDSFTKRVDSWGCLGVYGEEG